MAKTSRSPRRGRKTVTIADVAQRSGVSVATVTRSLQQSPLVRPSDPRASWAEPALMEKYVEAATRVMANLDAALAAPRPED